MIRHTQAQLNGRACHWLVSLKYDSWHSAGRNSPSSVDCYLPVLGVRIIFYWDRLIKSDHSSLSNNPCVQMCGLEKNSGITSFPGYRILPFSEATRYLQMKGTGTCNFIPFWRTWLSKSFWGGIGDIIDHRLDSISRSEELHFGDSLDSLYQTNWTSINS